MTIELSTGIDRPPRREDYCTKQTTVAPAEPGTPCDLWLTFLDRITNKDDELIGFLQGWLGYCLSGYVHEHVMVFLYGTGANGKGVFTSTVAGIFGDYCVTVPVEMLIEARFDRHPTEIARLRGVRLALAQETQQGRRWDEAKIKNLTGADRLTARFMRGDFFDFNPSHKLMVSGNHKPSLRHVDEAMRRRLLLVPCVVTIPEPERDRHLAEKLKPEWPAILRWMVEGHLQWRERGLCIPESVRRATDEYFADQDSLEEWLAECTNPLDPLAFTTTGRLFASWQKWCEARHQFCGSDKEFSAALKAKGYEHDRRKKGRGFKGLSLKSDTEQQFDLR
jgi:putative DNA primase/helicase